MTLSAATLAAELEALEPTSNASEAIERLAYAWEAYFGDATVGVTAVADGTLTAARAAMVGAMPGLSVDAAAAIQAGITAWWTAVAGSAAVIWAGNAPPVLSATVPPSLATIGAALTAAFSANTAASADLATAANVIANVLHPLTLGAVASIGPPASTLPIL